MFLEKSASLFCVENSHLELYKYNHTLPIPCVWIASNDELFSHISCKNIITCMTDRMLAWVLTVIMCPFVCPSICQTSALCQNCYT